MAESESSDQPEAARPCPKSPFEASQLAIKDVQKFKKMYYSGTWSGFLHQFRLKYTTCPEYIKQVYVESARQAMNVGSSQTGSFQNLPKK
jgi:hypothetical protein